MKIRPHLELAFCLRPLRIVLALPTGLLLASSAWVTAAERQMLHGNVPEVVRRLQPEPVGRLPGTNVLNLLIGLPLRNPAAFTNSLKQLYEPASPRFHHWLKPEQIER